MYGKPKNIPRRATAMMGIWVEMALNLGTCWTCFVSWYILYQKDHETRFVKETHVPDKSPSFLTRLDHADRSCIITDREYFPRVLLWWPSKQSLANTKITMYVLAFFIS